MMMVMMMQNEATPGRDADAGSTSLVQSSRPLSSSLRLRLSTVTDQVNQPVKSKSTNQINQLINQSVSQLICHNLQ